MNSVILPLDVEVEGVGDGEVPVVDDEDVADVDLDLDEVGLHAQEFPFMYKIHAHYFQFCRFMRVFGGTLARKIDGCEL